MRGNLLSIEKQWEDADSENSNYQPIPAHLNIVWQNELPYWQGLNEADINELKLYHQEVKKLLAGQNLSFEWLAVPVSDQVILYPAFVLVKVKLDRPLKRQVQHFENDHAAFCNFLVEALNKENVQTWRIKTEAVIDNIAIAAAPWFSLEDTSHIAVALAKVDHYVFK